MIFTGVTNYLDAFYLPTNSVPLSVHALAQTSPEYYSHLTTEAHTSQFCLSRSSASPSSTLGTPQCQWLTNDLALTGQPWKIIIFHVPMNTSSAHRFDDSNFNGIYAF